MLHMIHLLCILKCLSLFGYNKNQDVINFTIAWINSAKNMLQHIQISKKKIYIRVIIKPSDGSDAPQEYRRIFRLSQY